MAELFIGLMSGTSMDGADGVLADFSVAPIHVLQHVWLPFPDALKTCLLSLNSSGPDEIHRGALAANALARLYADVVQQLLQRSGHSSSAVQAIGAHGQTVRHRPQEFDGTGYTVQLNAPALLAELTGIDVVAEFRSRDVAAGGQGAPLVPRFHQAMFGQAGQSVQALNVGGIANLSVMSADGHVLGFDCGPGNALMDFWCQKHTGASYDDNGAWAASGKVNPEWLHRLQTEPFFHKPPPKSTGRDLFNPVWLSAMLRGFEHLALADVQATLTALTIWGCAQSVEHFGVLHGPLLVCGGGALNGHLMQGLQTALPGVDVRSTSSCGLPPLQVEAAAFAWLARQCLLREPGSSQSITGARGARVLGALYPR